GGGDLRGGRGVSRGDAAPGARDLTRRAAFLLAARLQGSDNRRRTIEDQGDLAMRRAAPALFAPVLFALGAFGLAAPALADTVKITPLGSHDGEFCPLDRALIFEDPDGTRLLYDVGRTVRGPDDPRLGRIDAVLLSHIHGDHLGDAIQPAANAGDCAKPDF